MLCFDEKILARTGSRFFSVKTTVGAVRNSDEGGLLCRKNLCLLSGKKQALKRFTQGFISYLL